MPSSHLILCHPLLLLPPILPSIRVFSNESALHMRWPKYWSFSFNISPSNEHPGLISFRMDWLDLLKEVLSKAARWKRCTGQGMWAGLRAPLPSPGTFTSLPTWKLAKSPSLDLYRGFMILGFPGGSDGKSLPPMQESQVRSTGLGRSPGGGHGNPL